MIQVPFLKSLKLATPLKQQYLILGQKSMFENANTVQFYSFLSTNVLEECVKVNKITLLNPTLVFRVIFRQNFETEASRNVFNILSYFALPKRSPTFLQIDTS